MSAKGRPTQYLGHCEYFKNQNLAKQQELLKSAKICYVCLAPMKDCRKPEDLKTCSKQTAWNLKCRHCNDLRHHSLICPSKPSQTYQAEHQNDSHRNGGRGGGRGGRGGGRGGRGGHARGGYQHNGDREPSGNSDSNQYYESEESNPTCHDPDECADLAMQCNMRQLHNVPNQQKMDQVQGQSQAKKQ